jgi:hypothetical protein
VLGFAGPDTVRHARTGTPTSPGQVVTGSATPVEMSRSGASFGPGAGYRARLLGFYLSVLSFSPIRSMTTPVTRSPLSTTNAHSKGHFGPPESEPPVQSSLRGFLPFSCPAGAVQRYCFYRRGLRQISQRDHEAEPIAIDIRHPICVFSEFRSEAVFRGSPVATSALEEGKRAKNLAERRLRPTTHPTFEMEEDFRSPRDLSNPATRKSPRINLSFGRSSSRS